MLDDLLFIFKTKPLKKTLGSTYGLVSLSYPNNSQLCFSAKPLWRWSEVGWNMSSECISVEKQDCSAPGITLSVFLTHCVQHTAAHTVLRLWAPQGGATPDFIVLLAVGILVHHVFAHTRHSSKLGQVEGKLRLPLLVESIWEGPCCSGISTYILLGNGSLLIIFKICNYVWDPHLYLKTLSLYGKYANNWLFPWQVDSNSHMHKARLSKASH